MEKVNVFQIGLGEFGRYGFRKFLAMHGNLDEVELEFRGLAEKDFEKRDDAVDVAESEGVDLDFYSSAREMYDAASEVDGKVLVYDAGPTATHAQNIYRSMRHEFFHVAEKPPSMTREQHIRERKMSAGTDAFWKADFIERESPVVRKALEEVAGKNIESIKVFRESSVGVQRLLQPVQRAGVQGGDILDKMTHEIFILDMLEESNGDNELDLVRAESDLMPFSRHGEKFMSVKGNRTAEKNRAATGRTGALIQGGAEVKLHSSWLGVSRSAREEARRLDFVDHNPVVSEPRQTGKEAFVDEEARFFVVEGERNLFGDMLKEKLFDLDREREVELPDLEGDQLHRVLKKAVLKAAGREEGMTDENEIDRFMNLIFDIRESAIDHSGDPVVELRSSLERLDPLVYDQKAFEDYEVDKLMGVKG
ncbi:MAG: hypothetical protein ABEJ03_04060 [Candidatus Nanohaloarchaea archaeon]